MNDIFSIAGRTVVVTGSAGTVGMALCSLLAGQGGRVAAIDINPEGALIETTAPGSRFYECDLTDQEALEAAAKEIKKDFESIDILINLACTFGTGERALDLSYERWQTDIKINVDTYFLSCTVFGRHMAQSGHGSIINFASTASYSYIKGSYKASYCVTKAAVASLTRSLAYEFAEHHVRVNAIAPGFIDIRENVLKGDSRRAYSDREADRINQVPLRKLAQIKDLWGPILLLASEASSYMTGQVVVVDGGFMLSH